jgi:hypothetical protein
MAVAKRYRSEIFEKVLLAAIPVIGSVLIALLGSNIKCNPSVQSESHSIAQRPNELRAIAGKVNDHVVYNRYQELFPMFAEGLKPIITQHLFNSERDSLKLVLGNFIKPIDTVYSKINSNDIFFIKNQYEKGTYLVSVGFDQADKVIALFTSKMPDSSRSR